MIGLIAPEDDRLNGATLGSTQRRHPMIALKEPGRG